jgi:DNA processing protein
VSDAVDRLRLIRSGQIGPVTYFRLLQRFGSAAAALDAIPDLAARGGGRAPRIADAGEVSREIEAVAKLGARHIFIGDADYPALLAELDSAPPALIVRGNADLPMRATVAIVGARNASAAACRFARELAHGLAEQDVTVISGLARGIDTAAHQGAGLAKTVAVIASGINVYFPPENRALQDEIASTGLLITEHPPGREPLARHFPARNRIIAGMALGTVVVEAAPKSGSLITARLANESGREVMAVPGSPLDQRAQGCNQLIREGATLIQSAADVMETIQPLFGGMMREPRASWITEPLSADASDGERTEIERLLGPTAVATDELIRQSGLPAAVVNTVLLDLELAGRIERHAGGRVSLA